MKSSKTVVPFEDTFTPYSFVPPMNIFVGVNGVSINLIRDQETTLTQGQFELLLTSDYAKYLP